MNIRSLILGLVAILIAGGAALGARSLISGSQAPKAVAAAILPKKTDIKVMIAAKPLGVGHILAVEDVKWQSWPQDGVGEGFMRKETDPEQSIVGKVIKAPVAQGAPLIKNQLVSPGDRGFLAAVLTKDMRAVTVAVTDTSSVGGFVFPGDRVDLILTYEVPQGNALPLKGAETILTNVRVLATDFSTDNAAKTATAVKTVTLEVPPTFVEKIAVMQRLGSVSLSLHALAGNTPDAAGATVPKLDAAGKVIAVKTDTKDVKTSTAKDGKIASNAKLPIPPADILMPSDKHLTLTLDRQVSKLVNLAKQTSNSASSAAVAPPKPDMVVSRGAAREEVFFKPAAPAASPLAPAASTVATLSKPGATN